MFPINDWYKYNRSKTCLLFIKDSFTAESSITGFHCMCIISIVLHSHLCFVSCRQFMLVSSNDYVRLRLHLTLMNLELMYDKLHDSLLVNGPGMSTALSIPLKVPDYNPSLVQTIT